MVRHCLSREEMSCEKNICQIRELSQHLFSLCRNICQIRELSEHLFPPCRNLSCEKRNIYYN
jgi:hypothetical protein